MFDKGFTSLTTTDILLLAFVAFLLFIFVCDIVMIASMIKTGDERKQMIVYRASFTTLWVTVGRWIIDIVRGLVNPPMTDGIIFIELGVVAMTYCVCMIYYKRKYGG